MDKDGAVEAMREFSQLVKKLEEQAYIDDPGLLPHLRKVQEKSPHTGWLDVAVIREKSKS